MNNIIEKLGVEPLKTIPCSNIKMSEMYKYSAIDIYQVLDLKRNHDDMLEALIEDLIEDELFYLSKGYTVDQLVEYGEDGKSEIDSFKRKQMVVEKATGKSWSEIQELLV